MECTNVLQSIDAVVRLVAEWAPSGCGNIRTKGAVLASRMDCDTMAGTQTLLNMLLDMDVAAVRVAASNVTLATLCASYDLRVGCTRPPSIATLLREAYGFTAGGDGVMAARKVTGAPGKCEGCNNMATLMERIASTFITDGTKTFVLLVQDSTGDPLDCDTVGLSALTLAAGALRSVGTCGMYAWRVSTP